MPPDRPGNGGGRPKPPDRPDYKVYRSRRGLFSGLRKPNLPSTRKPSQREPRSGRPSRGRPAAAAGERPAWRKYAKWALIAAGVWLLISFLAFAISAQIQKSKLDDSVKDALHGNPFMAISPQTILVLGTDIRSGQFAGPDEAAPKHCLDAAGSGKTPPSNCAPYRSDTIMLVRAGGGTFRKLSIPRDTLADIPGHGGEKINSAYALGGAKLTVQTVEQMLGLDIDQIAIIDFDGFRKFIDSIGGVTVNLPTDVCSSVSGGAFNLKLKKGENHLNGYQAITLARTRENTCGEGQFTGTDFERTQFQQLILDGIKNQLTSISRLPYNFIKGPWIGWNAPKAMVSSMGAWTMPQLAFSAAIGGGGGQTDFLKPASQTAAGNLFVAKDECVRAVKKFLGGDPPHDPECSPAP
jgi:LCP family protein required for cell wall assembly